ncbi:MAG: D-amino acid dehydrogenase [Rhodospirillaceae bacterium]|nr:D-amino acid dehydrogenase [Rhodospirillaceae bacterium]
MGGKRIVVLGAGVVGVTTAWYLARDGHEVTVIDRQPGPARETSFANAGLIAPGHAYVWSSPRAPKILLASLVRRDQALRLKLRADPRMWSWCLKFLRCCTAEQARRNTLTKLRLCIYSHEALKALSQETGLDYDRRSGGLLYLYRDAASLDRGVAHMGILAEGGRRLEVLDAAGVVRVDPALAAAQASIAGAIYAPDDESGDCYKFTEGLAALCRARGVTFRYGTTVTGFVRTDGRVSQVETSAGPVSGELFVLALGSYAPLFTRRLGFGLPVYPVKGYSATVPIAGRNGAPTVGGVDENNLVAYCRMGDRLRLTATAEFAGYDTRHRPADFRAMLGAARALFPQGGDYDRATFWACLRPMTPEGTPILGPSPVPNLMLNTGHGHMGWTMACGSARILADLVAGRKPDIDTAELMLESA